LTTSLCEFKMHMIVKKKNRKDNTNQIQTKKPRGIYVSRSKQGKKKKKKKKRRHLHVVYRYNYILIQLHSFIYKYIIYRNNCLHQVYSSSSTVIKVFDLDPCVSRGLMQVHVWRNTWIMLYSLNKLCNWPRLIVPTYIICIYYCYPIKDKKNVGHIFRYMSKTKKPWKLSRGTNTMTNVFGPVEIDKGSFKATEMPSMLTMPLQVRSFQVFSMFSVRGRIGFKLWKIKQNNWLIHFVCNFDQNHTPSSLYR
jgi:hypothetical protein